MDVFIMGSSLSVEEIESYKKYMEKKHPDIDFDRIIIKPDGEDVELYGTGTTRAVPFERIRRITGYLVGTLDRFNDAKLAEEADRVKHDVSEPEQEDIPVQEM